MTTVTLLYEGPQTALGARIRRDLQSSGYTVVDKVQPGPETLVITVIGPETIATIEPELESALDENQHIIVVLKQPMKLPGIISNLEPLDFRFGYNWGELLTRVEKLTAPDAPVPITVLTPRRRAQNRRTALLLLIPIGIMFAAAIVGVILNITVPPADEFAGVETQIYLTRNHFIDQALPDNTQEAEGFMGTVERYNETVQPFLILTATGVAEFGESTFYPRTTEEAEHFPATLERVSTMVRDRMIATVTQLAVDSLLHEATATPESSG
jgi:hypothetical protein